MDDNDDDALLGYILKLSEPASSGSEAIGLLTPDELWNALRATSASNNGGEQGLPRRIDGPLTTDVSGNDFPVHWREGLLKIGSVLRLKSTTAFDVHLAASQAIPLGLETGSSSSSDATRTSEATHYLVLCILLCCWALNAHGRDASAMQRRTRRWQSLVIETLRLFQKHCTNSTNSFGLTAIWIPLWVQQVLPAMVRVQRRLLSFSIPKSSSEPNLITSLRSNDVAFLSAAVAVTSKLARRCCQVTTHTQDIQQTIKLNLERLLRALWDPLEGCFDEILWLHPWRQRFGVPAATEEGGGSSDSFRNLQSALSFWSVTRDENDGAFSMVDTEWDSRGVAALAAAAGDFCRDCVTSPAQIWKTWLPHVTTLLDDDSDQDSEAENEDTNSGSENERFHFHALGFQLLDSTIRMVPSGQLDVKGTQAYSISGRLPDDPIGLLQLLSNRLLSSSVESIHDRNASRHLFPRGGEVFQIMRTLLDRYQPQSQIRIVRVLARDCPHPGLTPKLVDLLRPFVAWDDSQAVACVWLYIDEVLARLEKHFEPTQAGPDPHFVELDELLDSTEFYASSLSLIYLWIRVKGSLPEVPHLEPRLTNLYNQLQTTGVHDDERYFRLHLLQSLLKQSVEALSMLR